MRRFLMAVAVVAIAALSSTITSVGAAPKADTTFEAEAYATEYGVSLQEATKRLDRIDELKILVAEVVEAEAGRIAGHGIVHEPSFGAWILLTDDAQPSKETRRLQRKNVDLVVELSAQYSYEELLLAMRDESRFDHVPSEVASRIVMEEIDMNQNRVVVTVSALAASETDGVQACRFLFGALYRPS